VRHDSAQESDGCRVRPEPGNTRDRTRPTFSTDTVEKLGLVAARAANGIAQRYDPTRSRDASATGLVQPWAGENEHPSELGVVGHPTTVDAAASERRALGRRPQTGPPGSGGFWVT
jgi:hypothetical protein